MDFVEHHESEAPNFDRCASCGLVHALGDFCKPPRVRYADQGYRINQPVIVHSRADIASLLRAHRIASGLTCEAFDALAGWSDRYVTKLENFKGTITGGTRPSFTIEPPTPGAPDGTIAASFMAEIWLETAGLALVLLPAELAKSIGAVPAPKRT